MGETRGISPRQLEVRGAQAHGFLNAGNTILGLWGQSTTYEEETVASVVGSLAVLSGIASADVICGVALGYHSATGDHNDAVKLLRGVDARAAEMLQALLLEKSNVQYSTKRTSLDKGRLLLKHAKGLYGVMLRRQAGTAEE